MNRVQTIRVIQSLVAVITVGVPAVVYAQSYYVNDTCGSPYSFCIYAETTWSGSSAAIEGQADGGVGMEGIDTSGGIGVYGVSTSGNGIQALSTSGHGVYGVSSSATGIVGLGYGSTTTPSYPYGVFGSTPSGGSDGVHGTTDSGAAGVAGINTNTSSCTMPGCVGTWGQSDLGYGAYGTSTYQAGVYGTSTYGYGVYGTSTNADGGDAIHGYNNSNVYAGVAGDNETTSGCGSPGATSCNGVWAGSHDGIGLYAQTTYGQYAVYANNVSDGGSTNYGVYGTGSSYGLYGASGSVGVYGDSTSGGRGVWGVSGYRGVEGDGGSTTGSIGIYGTSSGEDGWAGYFSGAVEVTGEIYVGSCSGCTSDSRLKKNVKPLTGAIDQLLGLKGVTYEWIDPTAHKHEAGEGIGTQIGFIAQDVERVFPNMVKQDGYTAPDGQKYKTLEMKQIEALEVESIRTLKMQNDDLRERVRMLETGRRVMAGLDINGVGFAVGGLALAGAVVITRRKRNEEK